MKKHPDTVKNDDLQAHLKYLVDAVASIPKLFSDADFWTAWE